jgi:hypothetical protein
VIHDRLLRAAMVGVAKGVPAAKTEAAKAPEEAPEEENGTSGHNVDTQA